MLIIHNEAGYITSLQLAPPTSELPHIVVEDGLFDVLQPHITAGIQLDGNGEHFFIPSNLVEQLSLLSFEQRRTEKRNQIEQAQSLDLRAGVSFNFGGVADLIQTRGERDLINISGVATQAMILKNAGVNEPVIQFRAESNTTYMLTPDEAIALGVAVASHSQTIYAKAWALKDAIAAAMTIEELELLQW